MTLTLKHKPLLTFIFNGITHESQLQQPNETYKWKAKPSQDTELYPLYQTELEAVAYNTLHPVRG